MADEDEGLEAVGGESGEVSIDDVNQDDGGGSGLSEVILEGLDDSGGDDPGGKKAEKKTIEVSVEEHEKLKGLYDGAANHIKELQKALHESRSKNKEEKKAQDDQPVLSKQELMNLWKEHHDDPETLFKIANYMAEQAAKGESGKAIDAAKVGERKKEIDTFVSERYPDLSRSDSELRIKTDQVKEGLGLSEDNPYGDFLALGAQTIWAMPHIIQAYYQKGRADAESGKAEKSRKELVKESSLTPKGKGTARGNGGATLTDSQNDIATRLGLTGKKRDVYAAMVNKKATTVMTK